MKKYLFMAVAAIAALSSCSNDNEVLNNEKKQGLVFTATMENSEATRATITSDKRTAWKAGDQISINGYIYSAQADGTTTTFKAVDKGATDTPYNAYFPASLYNGTTATLPATQTYEAGKFNMPMYASSTTTELKFYNLCAVLAVKVTSDDIATLKSIKVVSDKVMNGTFTVDKDAKGNYYAKMGTDGTNTVVLKSSEALSLTSEGTTFYIAIPAQKYQELKIEISNGTGITASMTTKKGADITIERSKIYNITFKATTGTATRTGGAIVNWVQLWAGGPKFATYNVGAKNNSPEDYGDYYCWETADIATALWGENWRIPTEEELWGLFEYKNVDDNNYIQVNCEMLRKGDEGYSFTGAGVEFIGKAGTDYANNSVFLPAAGRCYNKEDIEQEQYGNYWASTTTETGKWISFGASNNSYLLNPGTGDCYSVRAVLNEE